MNENKVKMYINILYLRGEESTLTHVELSNKAGHIIVLEVLRQDFLGKASLVKHMETSPSLK